MLSRTKYIEDIGLNVKLDKQQFKAVIVESPDVRNDLIIPKTIQWKEKTYTVTKIGDGAFRKNEKLKTVSFDQDSEVIEIGSNAFSQSATEKVNIPQSVSKIDPSFALNTVQTFQIIVDKNNQHYKSFNKMLIEKGGYCNDTIIFASRDVAEVEIPPTVRKIGNDAFEHCSNLKSVQFLAEDNLKPCIDEICDDAFRDCLGLSEFSIPFAVKKIGNYAFNNCQNLKHIVFEMDNTVPCQLEEIGDSAFAGCSNLVSIEIPSNVKTIGDSAFDNCQELSEIKFQNSHDSPSHLEMIGRSCFSDCRKVEQIEMPESVTKIDERAFNWCVNLKQIVFTDESKLESVGELVIANTSIEILQIPSHVNDLDIHFLYGADHLIHVEVSQMNNHYTYYNDNLLIKTGGYDDGLLMFARKNIENAVIPAFVTKIEKRAFTDRNKLKSVTFQIDKGSMSKLLEIDDDSFDGCSALEEVLLPVTITRIGNHAFDCCRQLKHVNFIHSDGVAPALEVIGDHAFSHCEKLAEFNVPTSVKTIGKYAFNDCWNMSSISFTSEDRQSQLERISNFAFSHCTSLVEFSVPSSCIHIDNYVFNECHKLETLIIPEDSHLDTIGAAFIAGTLVKSLSIPASVTDISETYNAKAAKLKSVKVSSKNKHYKSIRWNPYIKVKNTCLIQ